MIYIFFYYILFRQRQGQASPSPRRWGANPFDLPRGPWPTSLVPGHSFRNGTVRAPPRGPGHVLPAFLKVGMAAPSGRKTAQGAASSRSPSRGHSQSGWASPTVQADSRSAAASPRLPLDHARTAAQPKGPFPTGLTARADASFGYRP